MNDRSNKNLKQISLLFILSFVIFSLLTVFIVNNIIDYSPPVNLKRNTTIYITVSFLVGLVVSLLGLAYLAKEYKKDLLGFTPSEIAILYSENKSIIDQLNEAVISVNLDYNINTINDAFKKMFNLTDQDKMASVSLILPELDFKTIITTKTQTVNKMIEINNEKLLVSSFPLYSDSKVIGATMIFRSRLEVDMLLDQISGYRKISKALREQKHEFQNKLHVIMGLIKMKDYDLVNTYINQNVYHTNLTSDYYSSRIKDDQISALFVGKDVQSKEFETLVQLSNDSFLSRQHNPVSSDDLIIIIGNLIDNALEAFKGKDIENRRIDVKVLEDDSQIKISVSDNAGGIDPKVRDRMFVRGVSTKPGENRGTGLHLVNEIVKLYSGSKQIQSSRHKTYIEIILEKVKS